MKGFVSTFAYKLIYVFRINDQEHKGLLKIGETTCDTDKTMDSLVPNCKELNMAAKNRIDQYTAEAGIKYDLLYTELAVYSVIKSGKSQIKAFSDHDVHKVLERSNIKKHVFDTQRKANEWYKTDLETAKKAILAVKQGRASLTSNEISQDKSPIIFRPEQRKAITDTKSQFRKGNRMLWNAKMRFGKTLTALQVAKEMGFAKTIILTHRPVVSDGWYDDFGKIFYDTDYVFGSKTKGEKIENLIDTDKKFVYFASMQDLRGSDAIGGKFFKNDDVFLTKWDFVVIDEAHEGTQTKLGKIVIDTIEEFSENPKVLRLSGTPFNLLDQFKEDEVYTWDYVMEQREKRNWDLYHFGDSNPYASLPELQIFTYDLNKLISGYFDEEDQAFNFREFFRTWTGIMEKDFKPIPAGSKIGEFVHKDDVNAFLNLLCKKDNNSNYPYSTEEYRNYFRHSLWMVPGVKEAKALSALLNAHPVFGSGIFKIVNVAGDGDEEVDSKDALAAVRNAFGPNPAESYTITISCGRLTTGVSVPEWTAVFMLSGSSKTTASSYLQTIFRVQTPANINGQVKERCCVFDFAPDRTLKMVAEARQLSARSGNNSTDRIIMGEFLNFCPVIGIEGSKMTEFNVDSLLQQLKKAYTERVVKNGFDDPHIYNDNLLKLDNLELGEFVKLKEIIGASKQTKKQGEIDVNRQGLTNEQYEELGVLEKKPKQELTEEEKRRLEELKEKRKNRDTAISILRGISIRIPLLVYGANVPFDKEIGADNFTDLIDDDSWKEFMPKGVDKETFNKFSKYYDPDIFISAGRQIRNKAKAADSLTPTERVKKIVEIFDTFKNPDKETVLTPWRVVNMHLGDCLGGYDFYNEDHAELLDEPRFVDKGKVTTETLANASANILEINSKSGLYPLYVVYSIYRKRCSMLNPNELTKEKQLELWNKTVEENVFVICKTPMARAITKRTLLGYKDGKINAHAFDNLTMQLKDKPQQFIDKVKRGSFWNKEIKIMKFDAIVGNPPYQENVENRSEQPPVYHLFYNTAFALSEKVSLITPARFLFDAGKTPKDWNRKMLSDNHFKVIRYEENSKNIFPTVEIKGGIAITYRDEDEDFGAIGTFVKNDIIGEVVDKVRKKSSDYLSSIIYSNTSYKYSQKLFQDHPEFLEKDENGKVRLSGGSARYLASSALEKLPEIFYAEMPNSQDYVKIIGRKDNHRAELYIKREYLLPPENFHKYKVFMSSSNGTGVFGETLTLPFVGKPFVGSTETFLTFGNFDTESEAQNLIKYIKTKFARALLGSLKVTQGNKNSAVWANIPLQDFTTKSDINWQNSVIEIDKQLYKKYNLTEEEISFIETSVKPME